MLSIHHIQSWQQLFEQYFQTEAGKALKLKVETAYQNEKVFPSYNQIFQAFKLTPLDQVRVVILGQDPYHDEGQAQGLAFSVPKGMKLPPSLRNIYNELADDLAVPAPLSGDLTHWAKQGVLLLNTTLTVEAHKANSHQSLGWYDLTDQVIRLLNLQKRPIIFVLWGKPAQQKQSLITGAHHHLLMAPHPSPLSAYRGFFGSKPFSKINQLLEQPINWIEAAD